MLTYPEMAAVLQSKKHDEQSAKWVQALQLAQPTELKRFERIGCGTCAAACFPDAPEDVIQLAADQISFLFLFDDLYPEGLYRHDPDALRLALQPFIDLVAGKGDKGHSTAYAKALADLVSRAAQKAPSFWRRRYAASFQEYCDGCVLEARYRLQNQTPTLNAYLELRRGSIGMSPMFDVMELTHGVFLSEAQFASSAATKLRQLGADLSTLVNDLSSLEKEEAVGDVCNVVIVMQAQRACSRDEALDAVATLHNALLDELHRLERTLTNDAPGSALALYARSIRQWVHGHYGWILSSRRYLADKN